MDRLITYNKDLKYIPIICYEIIFYWRLINSLNYDSDFIVNITNDFWFGDNLGPYQHLYLTRLRALEFNKKLIRVSNNGISAVIDENGKILSNTNLNKAGKIKKTIFIKKNNPIYYSIHYYLKIYFFIILLMIILFSFKKKNEY